MCACTSSCARVWHENTLWRQSDIMWYALSLVLRVRFSERYFEWWPQKSRRLNQKRSAEYVSGSSVCRVDHDGDKGYVWSLWLVTFRIFAQRCRWSSDRLCSLFTAMPPVKCSNEAPPPARYSCRFTDKCFSATVTWGFLVCGVIGRMVAHRNSKCTPGNPKFCGVLKFYGRKVLIQWEIRCWSLFSLLTTHSYFRGDWNLILGKTLISNCDYPADIPQIGK